MKRSKVSLRPCKACGSTNVKRRRSKKTGNVRKVCLDCRERKKAYSSSHEITPEEIDDWRQVQVSKAPHGEFQRWIKGELTVGVTLMENSTVPISVSVYREDGVLPTKEEAEMAWARFTPGDTPCKVVVMAVQHMDEQWGEENG